MKCLIADPSMVTRRAIAGALRPLGPEVIEAATVDDAFAACDESIEVLLAGWSEGFEGPALARRLRERGEGGAPRIVLVSAHHGREQVLEAIAAGIDAYVLRPFDPDALCARVAALASAGATEGEAEQQAA